MDEQQASLTSAQKLDPAIVQVIGSAPSVAIYGFNNGWEKSNHEGALLICQRKTSPEYCFVILSTVQPQNYLQILDPGTTLQRKGEYLLYKTPLADAVQAVWFYAEADCLRIFDLVKGVLDKAKEMGLKKSHPPAASLASKSLVKDMGKDILTMLSSATSAHKGDQQAPSRGQGQTIGRDGVRGGGGDLQRSSALGAGGDARPSQQSSASVENLFKNFASARNGASAATSQKASAVSDFQGKESPSSGADSVHWAVGPLGKGRGRSITSTSTDIAPALQRLLQPGAGATDQQQQPTSAFTNVSSRQRAISGIGGAAPGVDSLISNLRQDKVDLVGAGTGMVPPLAPAVPMMSPPGAEVNEGKMLDLLTPADLGAAVDDSKSNVDAFNRAAAAAPFSPPSAFERSPPRQTISGTPTANLTVEQTTFNVEQFRQSFVYLLEHNDDFVKRLYDAFVQASAQRHGHGNAFENAWRKN